MTPIQIKYIMIFLGNFDTPNGSGKVTVYCRTNLEERSISLIEHGDKKLSHATIAMRANVYSALTTSSDSVNAERKDAEGMTEPKVRNIKIRLGGLVPIELQSTRSTNLD